MKRKASLPKQQNKKRKKEPPATSSPHPDSSSVGSTYRTRLKTGSLQPKRRPDSPFHEYAASRGLRAYTAAREEEQRKLLQSSPEASSSTPKKKTRSLSDVLPDEIIEISSDSDDGLPKMRQRKQNARSSTTPSQIIDLCIEDDSDSFSKPTLKRQPIPLPLPHLRSPVPRIDLRLVGGIPAPSSEPQAKKKTKLDISTPRSLSPLKRNQPRKQIPTEPEVTIHSSISPPSQLELSIVRQRQPTTPSISVHRALTVNGIATPKRFSVSPPHEPVPQSPTPIPHSGFASVAVPGTATPLAIPENQYNDEINLREAMWVQPSAEDADEVTHGPSEQEQDLQYALALSASERGATYGDNQELQQEVFYESWMTMTAGEGSAAGGEDEKTSEVVHQENVVGHEIILAVTEMEEEKTTEQEAGSRDVDDPQQNETASQAMNDACAIEVKTPIPSSIVFHPLQVVQGEEIEESHPALAPSSSEHQYISYDDSSSWQLGELCTPEDQCNPLTQRSAMYTFGSDPDDEGNVSMWDANEQERRDLEDAMTLGAPTVSSQIPSQTPDTAHAFVAGRLTQTFFAQSCLLLSTHLENGQNPEYEPELPERMENKDEEQRTAQDVAAEPPVDEYDENVEMSVMLEAEPTAVVISSTGGLDDVDVEIGDVPAAQNEAEDGKDSGALPFATGNFENGVELHSEPTSATLALAPLQAWEVVEIEVGVVRVVEQEVPEEVDLPQDDGTSIHARPKEDVECGVSTEPDEVPIDVPRNSGEESDLEILEVKAQLEVASADSKIDHLVVVGDDEPSAEATPVESMKKNEPDTLGLSSHASLQTVECSNEEQVHSSSPVRDYPPASPHHPDFLASCFQRAPTESPVQSSNLTDESSLAKESRYTSFHRGSESSITTLDDSPPPSTPPPESLYSSYYIYPSTSDDDAASNPGIVETYQNQKQPVNSFPLSDSGDVDDDYLMTFHLEYPDIETG